MHRGIGEPGYLDTGHASSPFSLLFCVGAGTRNIGHPLGNKGINVNKGGMVFSTSP